MSTATALSALLIDTSGSMAYPVGPRQRIDIAADVLRMILAKTPHARVVIFNSYPIELVGLEPTARSLKLPQAGGGTAVHLALDLVAAMTPKPDKVVVVSDGEPDDDQAPLRSACALAPCEINAFHIGPNNDTAAVSFMQELARAGGVPGTSGARSLEDAAALAAEITLLLGGPAR